MPKPEYVKIQFSKIPQEFVDEYELTAYVHNGWVYFEILWGAYGLPQSGILSNTLLRKRLEKEGYYETQTTPGLWIYKWRPIMFWLIVDDFRVEYVEKRNVDHLANVLKQHHTISEDWKGEKYDGMDIDWEYLKRTYRATMDGYIQNIRLKYDHPDP